MAPLRYAAKFDPFLSLDYPPPWAIQRKEGIKFCQLTTLKTTTTGETVERIGIVILLVGDNLKKFSLEDEKDFESGFAE